MIIQIYEIQDPREAEKCIELGVDHIGSVILSLEAWKQPQIKETIGIAHSAGKKSSLICLFQDLHTISSAIEYYQPDFIHFCESVVDNFGRPIDLDPFLRLQESIKHRFPEIQIMRSIPIAPPGRNPSPPSLAIAKEFIPVTDIFLTDTWLGREPVKGYIGITGRPLDWNVAAQLVKQTRLPVILAGGLSPDNVYEAVVKVRPAGADSCTGTNMADEKGRPIRFKKDFVKVRRFVSEIRRAEQELARMNRQ